MSSNVASIEEARNKQGLKVTLGELIDSIGESPIPGRPPNGPLARLYGTPFPTGKGRQGALFQRVMRDVLEELKTFEPVRMELLKRYGTSTDGTNYRVEGENFLKWKAEMDEARGAEIILPHAPMPELRDFWSVSPAEDAALVWLVGEPEE